MLDYFLDLLAQLRNWLAVAILAPVWESLRVHWAGFLWSDPVFWVCCFWMADWVLGVSLAIKDGAKHPDDPDRGFRASKAGRSVLKLLVYWLILAFAWGIRKSSPAGYICAACIESGVIWWEAASGLRNLGDLFELPFVKVFADNLENRVMRRKEKREALTQ